MYGSKSWIKLKYAMTRQA